MTQIIDFKDAVNAAVLNPDAKYAVYYMDGKWPNESQVRARCPNAKLFGITVVGRTGHDVFACDCETGDLTIDQAVAWVEAQVNLGVALIVVYADTDNWINGGLLARLEHYGDRIKRWVADYDNVAEVPSWADAKQYATGDVDLDVARADFFESAPKPKPKPKPDPQHYDRFDNARRVVSRPGAHPVRHARERGTVEEYDRKRKHPRLFPLRLKRLKANLTVFAERLEHLDKTEPKHDHDWSRDWRLEQIKLRAAGHQVVK